MGPRRGIMYIAESLKHEAVRYSQKSTFRLYVGPINPVVMQIAHGHDKYPALKAVQFKPGSGHVKGLIENLLIDVVQLFIQQDMFDDVMCLAHAILRGRAD